jgi:hypothetical protein
MRFKTIDWLRPPDEELIASFGEARLVRGLDGKCELRGVTPDDRTAAKEWISLFWHEAVPRVLGCPSVSHRVTAQENTGCSPHRRGEATGTQ